LTHVVNHIDSRLRTGRRPNGADGNDGAQTTDDDDDSTALTTAQEAH
jgi:hypothetical protein